IPAIVSNVLVKPFEDISADILAVAPTDTAEDLPVISLEAVLDAPVVLPSNSATSQAQAGEPQHTAASPSATAVENILRVDADRIDTVLNLVGELIIGKSMLQQAINEFGKRFPKDPLRARFTDMMAYQSQALNELQRSVMKIRMVPVEQLFRRFPRVVRDVARMRNKEVEFESSGAETDLDKSILDALADPMMHLVRNAVDHGIEAPADRLAAGKPAQGVVKLDAYHQGNHVVIEVRDDGRGIDVQKIMTRAINTGVVTAEAASRMTDSEILNLIFEPGFSTADEITEISGRGIGLDVVKTLLERMKGSVQLQSRIGEGTTFLLKVPLTLAIIRALLFRSADRLYAVPLGSVLEIARASESDIHRVDNKEVLQLREEVLTLVRTGRLSNKNANSESGKLFIIVVSLADRKFGLVVDKLVGEEELVIKALDDHLISTDLVSGASILGDGTVVLILNIAAAVERLGRKGNAGTPKELGNAITTSLGAQA
ncbi:MAG TPA: chemotaxis protein CheA, partial [Terriglobales bacterium]|nr:chemotaxis protein CheA [Terriglobales bacterium]